MVLNDVDDLLQHMRPETMTPNDVVKIEPLLPTVAPVELFWIDQAGSKHRRKLINTHTQKRSRRLKRLNDASSSQSTDRSPEMLSVLKHRRNCNAADGKTTPGAEDSQPPRWMKEPASSTNALKMRETATYCIPLAPEPFSTSLHLGLEPFDSLSVALNNQAGTLLKFAETMSLSTETISAHWGKSCVASLGLSWCFSYPVKLLNLLERVSAYVDTVQGLEASPRTIFWRHAAIQRLAALISNPRTRHGEEVLSGIVAQLHGYLHRYRGVHKGSATTDGPHSAGLRNFVSHVGGWSRLNLTPQVEEYVRMAMIITSIRLASYLDDFEGASGGNETLLDWQVEVEQVASLFAQMDAWALQHYEVSFQDSPKLPLDELEPLLSESSGICGHCHKLFVLVWLSLTRWHSRRSPGQYEYIIHTVNRHFRSLPHRALPDFSWSIISSRAGDEKSHWQTIEILKVLHRTRHSTQDQVCRWLFDFIHGPTKDGFLGMQSSLREQLLRDALEGLPEGYATGVQSES
ncbi:hypothetical protein CLAIMM_08129 [Cladophialophora immunda]|nr:hypothetical protein CLAIMM_08129 [Cladophialophora immunda]